MSRLLAISWALPPILKPRSLQVARLLKGLSELGWQIDVITVDPQTSITARPLDTLLEKHYQSAFTVHRAKSSYRQLLYILLGKLWPALNPIPDTEIPWRKAAAKLGQGLVKQNHYDALISFGQPWSSHLVAQSIHVATKLPWLAHFSDPWADNPYYTSLTSRQFARMTELEAEIIHSADAVVFTNSFTADLVMKKYPADWASKARVLPHSFDVELLPQVSRDDSQRGEFLRLVYAGNLYGLRSADSLIRALALVKHQGQIRLQFVGGVNRKQRYEALSRQIGVANLIEFCGQVSYQKSLQLLSKADALVLIDAPSANSLFLPSKLSDYLMFRKLILGITPLQGASAELLTNLGCPVVEPGNISGIAAELDRLVDLWHGSNLALSAPAQAYAQRFSNETLAREFEGILTDLSHGTSPPVR